MDHHKAKYRIRDLAVKVGEALIGRVVYQERQQSYHFDDLRMIGKQISIQGSATENKSVQLAEVEVFGEKITSTAEGEEVLAGSPSETLLCAATGISQTMKISWSGWESSNNADSDDLDDVQRTDISVSDDETYTCTLSSEKHQPSDSASKEVPLLVYKVECKGKIVYSGWNTILSCTICVLSHTAIENGKFGTEVS